MGFPTTRCPMLGHEVALSYCYRVAGGRPCRRLFGCWETIIPGLHSVVARLMTREEWRACFETPAPSKMDTLLGLVDQAQATLKGRYETGESAENEGRNTTTATSVAGTDDVDRD